MQVQACVHGKQRAFGFFGGFFVEERGLEGVPADSRADFMAQMLC